MTLISGNAFKVILTHLILSIISICKESNYMTPSMHQVIYNFISSTTTLGMTIVTTSVSMMQLLTTQPSNIRDI